MLSVTLCFGLTRADWHLMHLTALSSLGPPHALQLHCPGFDPRLLVQTAQLSGREAAVLIKVHHAQLQTLLAQSPFALALAGCALVDLLKTLRSTDLISWTGDESRAAAPVEARRGERGAGVRGFAAGAT